VTERSHLSIGEVLNLLQDEFPDITISKIRFLESQGLLDPERTPSGYRKFYEEDIERLRWILRQQKENFLPLKVIKDRLASGDLEEPVPGQPTAVPAAAPVGVDHDGAHDDGHEAPVDASRSGDEVPVASTRPVAAASSPARTREPVAVGEIERPTRRAPTAGRGRTRGERAATASGGAEPVVPPVSSDAPSLLETGPSGVSLTRDEVLGATGLSASDLADLERFGLVESHTLGNTSYYDDDAVVVARLGATFMGHGVEARHLRMYKVSAEREAGVFEQLVMPLLKQRNPASRAQATERLDELAVLGGRLRAAMLRQALREHLGG
jgi:DNA-binding transcriptional MerR regulator